MSAASAPLAASLDALLPQTQCRRCGYASCADYARGLAEGETRPDRCPPGGDALAVQLGAALAAARGADAGVWAVDPGCGEVAPWRRARIVEADCIGCTRCIAACPVDAIIGAAKLMHAVIEDECTGCDLCLPVCPVDCIEMLAAPRGPVASHGLDAPGGPDAPVGDAHWTPLGPLQAWYRAGAPRARARFDSRARRVQLAGERKRARRARRTPGEVPAPGADHAQRADFVAAALARAKRRREGADA